MTDRPVVLVPLSAGVEYQAVRAHLRGLTLLTHPTGTVFESGELPGTGWRVVLVESGPGSGTAAVVTEQAQQWFGPYAVVSVGVADAIDEELLPGDVLVARRVHAYQGGRETDEGLLARPAGWEASHRLLQTAGSVLRGGGWQPPPEDGAESTGCRAHFAHLASGDVELGPPGSPVRRYLRQHYDHVVAVEQDGTGAAQAAHVAGTQFLAVRGIRGPADEQLPPAARQERHRRAAAAAAAATVAVLRRLDLPRQPARPDPAPPDPAPPKPAPPEPALPRVLAPDRAGLEASGFPSVARNDLLDKALRRRDQLAASAGHAVGLVLTGEGGIGKSVMLGQLLQRLQDAGEAVLLVSCAQLPPESLTGGRAAADLAMGASVSPRGDTGLLALLAALRDRYGKVTLLVDTLDLVLGRSTLAGLSAVVAEALSLGEVVMTCRDHEYRTYLERAPQSAPRLAGRLVTYELPLLSPDQIVGWATGYLTARRPEPTPSDAQFLGVLTGKVTVAGPLREVCALPVRLTMACSVYAAEGHIPEDLTTTRLYSDYWDLRVRTVGGIVETAKEQAALALAARLLTGGGTLTVRVPKGALPPDLAGQLGLLVSEGVVREFPDRWEFFHQSFGEYAHGRHLLNHGLEGPGITELATALADGNTNLWPLAKSLLSQVRDEADYTALALLLPVDTPDAAQAQSVAALGRPDAAALARTLERVGTGEGLLEVVVPLLGNAPERHFGPAQEALVRAVAGHPVRLAGPAVAALAALLPRVYAAGGPARLLDALDAVRAVRPLLPADVWKNLPTVLLGALTGRQLPAADLEGLRERYRDLGGLGCRDVILLHLGSPVTPDRTVELARCVLSRPCPSALTDPDAVALMELFWNSRKVRDEYRWSTWREVLTHRFPQRWANAQQRLVTGLVPTDHGIITGVLDDVLEGGQDLTRHVQVLSVLVRQHGGRLASDVLTRPAPDRAGAGSLAAVIGHIDVPAETRLRLLDWLVPARAAAPRNVWPAQIALAGDDPQAHERLLADALAAEVPPPVMDSMVRTWVRSAPPVLAALADRLRSLLPDTGGTGAQTRATLEGRLAVTDPAARAWTTRAMLDGSSAPVAGTAVKAFQEERSGPLTDSQAAWLVPLLASRHTDAVGFLAGLLADPAGLPDELLALRADEVVDQAAARIRASAERREDPGLAQELTALAIRTDRLAPLSAEAVSRVYAAVRHGLATGLRDGDAGRCSACVRDVSRLSGTLLLGRLDRSAIRALLADVLRAVSSLPGPGPTLLASLAHLLSGARRFDPHALDWLEELFADPELGPAVKLAVAPAVLTLDGARRDGRAWRLREVPGCPPEVATAILNATGDAG
ncbi:hypothetical protein ACIA8O_25995 [Kitasatospora sp. NPDC051853]|uniref:phosphorylase family protein n=1 Tax=Kitasatospora sp. NPDC051853 TaxID=3364058 RepID=UPI0037BCAFE8